MADNPTDERPRKRGPRRTSSSSNGQGARRSSGSGEQRRTRQPRQGGGADRQGGRQRSGRLSQEETEWARDLWRHGEPPEEIADQVGISLSEVENLIAGWSS